MLEDLKLLLGLEDTDKKTEQQLQLILNATKQRLKFLLGGLEPPEEMEYIILDVSVIRFNRIGSEGLSSHSVEGESLSWSENDFAGYMDDIQSYLDSQREAKLRPALQKLLPVLAMSAWGFVPDDLDFSFPSLWTPTAMETAEITLKKAQAIRDTFQAGLIRADTAQKELKKLEEETGMFGNLADEEIAENAGKTYQDVTALRDPQMGLGYGEAIDRTLEGTVQDAAVIDYNPYHDPATGRFTSGGGSGKIGKTKYAPSPQRSHKGIQIGAKKYAKLCGTLGTQYPGLSEGEVRYIRDAKRIYKVEADGYGGMAVLSSYPIK